MKTHFFSAVVLSAAIAVASISRASAQESEHLPRASYLFSDGIVNPASPEASSVAKYGEISGCNLYTGTVGYSIPIYTYSDKDFNIPIVLSYASNGYKPNVQTGILGLGWYLSTGWSVTREVQGIMDDAWCDLELYHFQNKYVGSVYYDGRADEVYGYAFLHKPSVIPLYRDSDDIVSTFPDWTQQAKAGAEYLKVQRVLSAGEVRATCFEDTPDIFHFSAPGDGGSFILRPARGYSFFDTSGPETLYSLEDNLEREGITSFIITNAEGYRYTFSSPDVNSSWSTGGNDDDINTVGSWKLTSIEAPSGAKVTMSYGLTTISQTIIPSITRESHYRYTDEQWRSGDDSEHELGGDWYNTSYSETVSRCLSSIVVWNARNEKVCTINFSYDDKAIEEGAQIKACKRLSGITVSNSSGETIRQCNFDYCLNGSGDEYDPTSRGVTFLKSVKIDGEGTYSFEYEDRRTTTFPAMGSYCMDWYGYWNPSVNITNFAPSSLNYCEAHASSRSWLLFQRQPNTAYAKKGMLNRINYPTGGYTLLSYEANTYTSDRTHMTGITSDIASGVRISGIYDYDSDGSPIDSRTFSYVKADGTGSGRLVWRPEIYCQYEMAGPQFHQFRRKVMSTSNDYPYMNGDFIEYPRVVENHGGGTIEYVFADADDGPANLNLNLEHELEDGVAWEVDITSNISQPFTALNNCARGMRQGRLLTRRECDGGVSRPVTCQSNSYEEYGHLPYIDMNVMTMGFGSTYRYYLQGIRKSSETVVEYDSYTHTDIVSRTQTAFDYDSMDRLAGTETTSSAEEPVTTVYSYHPEARTLLAGVDRYRAEELVSSERYTYLRPSAALRPNWYLPESMSAADISADGSASYVTRITLGGYDSLGNPGYSEDAQGNRTVYSWSNLYKGMYLTGKTLYPAGGTSGSPLQYSWTWKPLVGVLSEKDPSGRTLYYNYDNAGRIIMRKENNTVLNNYYYNIVGNEN